MVDREVRSASGTSFRPNPVSQRRSLPRALPLPLSLLALLVVLGPACDRGPSEPDGPLLLIETPFLNLQGFEGEEDPVTEDVRIEAANGSLSNVEVSAELPAWLSVELSDDAPPTTLTVSADPEGEPTGTSTAEVELSSPEAVNGPLTLTVQFQVVPPPRLELDAESLEFEVAPGADDPDPVVVDITNAGGGEITGLETAVEYAEGEPGGWLHETLLPPDSETHTALSVRVEVGSLEEGTYHATIEIASPDAENSPQSLAVDLTVSDGS